MKSTTTDRGSSSHDSTSSNLSGTKLHVGSRVTIAQDCDLRGDITIASGTVIQPKCSILATDGPIEIGPDCIVEEMVVIVNRRPQLMRIGAGNLFEVGCRIESPSIGDHNTFQPKCRVSSDVVIGSYTTVSAKCVVLRDSTTMATQQSLGDLLARDIDAETEETGEDDGFTTAIAVPTPSSVAAQTSATIDTTIPEEPEEEHTNETSTTSVGAGAGTRTVDLPVPPETIPDHTVIFGDGQRRHQWSGQGVGQMEALHAKHLDYLREAIPRVHKLKKII